MIWIPITLLSLTVYASPPHPRFRTQFMSAVQLVIFESNPAQLQRSQKLTLSQIKQTFHSEPALSKRTYDLQSRGNEILVLITSEEDIHQPLQHAITDMIHELNGRVRARGKSLFYRTSLSEPRGGFLEVIVNESHDKIVSVTAQSVKLRDLLRDVLYEMDGTESGGVSYILPGECADKKLDYQFGNHEKGVILSTSAEAIMGELARISGLKVEKKNGAFIFSGHCEETLSHHREVPIEVAPAISRSTLQGIGEPRLIQVAWPLMPIE